MAGFGNENQPQAEWSPDDPCFASTFRRLLCSAILGLSFAWSAGPAAAADDAAQTIVHMLDYVGVDYAEAVDDGKVKNADEYKEMIEFASHVRSLLAGLPQNPARAALQADAAALATRIDAKVAPSTTLAEFGD